MDLNKKVLERIIQDHIANDRDFCKLLIGNKYFIGSSFNEKYLAEVALQYYQEDSKSDGYIVNFNVSFYDHSCCFLLLTRRSDIVISELLYKQYNRELILQEMAITQEDKIRKSLNEYLEFDSDKLFKSQFIVRIFGGAIRDIIAGQDINV